MIYQHRLFPRFSDPTEEIPNDVGVYSPLMVFCPSRFHATDCSIYPTNPRSFLERLFVIWGD
jgi:hypothetical protein